MRPYRVRRAADVTRDLDLIEEHLVKSYEEFGEDFESAVERAAARIGDALVYMRIFVTNPHRGTEHAEIWPGIRTVTNRNFIFYFEVDDLFSEVRIVAIFFGGVEHRQQIMDTLCYDAGKVGCGRAPHPTPGSWLPAEMWEERRGRRAPRQRLSPA